MHLPDKNGANKSAEKAAVIFKRLAESNWGLLSICWGTCITTVKALRKVIYSPTNGSAWR